MRHLKLSAVLVLLSGCAVHDSSIAHRAQQRLLGLSEVDLESCLGVPDQHISFGATDVLTYYAGSTSSTSFTVPVVGGIGMSNGAYCHATFRVVNGRVDRILYSGEKNATLAPDAYCAPISRTCLEFLDNHAPDAPARLPSMNQSSLRRPTGGDAGLNGAG